MSKGKESKQDAGTPKWLIDAVKAVMPLGVDAAASKENAKCKVHWDKQDNGLIQPWHQYSYPDLAIWCNHPYENCRIWVEKAAEETLLGATSIQLQPSAFHRKYYRELIKGGPCATVIINRPIKFDGYNIASSIVHNFYVWNKGLLGSGLNTVHEVDPLDPKEMSELFSKLRAVFV